MPTEELAGQVAGRRDYRARGNLHSERASMVGMLYQHGDEVTQQHGDGNAVF
jgi:hypothetical protein